MSQPAAIPTGTVTLLFTDIVGSTRLWETEPARMAPALRRHDDILRAAIEGAGGYVFKTVGDAFCAAFWTARAAVDAAVAGQRALSAQTWPTSRPILVRMGLHTGVSEERDGDYFGPAVNRAARLEAAAHGGQIVLSGTTTELVAGELPDGASLRDLGLHRLKDLGRPEQVFQLEAPGLAASFPPLTSLDNPELPNNLPSVVSAFVGRDSELAEVRELIEAARLVTLTGAGGSGKTRLSLQVAAEMIDGTGDGVWLVELAAVTDGDAVASAISRALGIAAQPSRPALEALVEALVPQDILIVLDNCEHLIDACAKTADAILRRCPRVHLIATSREPLGIAGETIYRVPSLSLPGPDEPALAAPESSDAVALFVDRVRAQGTGLVVDEQTIPMIVSICRRLDGLPLAIELAAARLRSLSLSGLHDRLDQRFRLLTGGSRAALERQQTLRATVDWSYSLLNAAETSLLRRLSVFAESFDLDAAEAVCGFGDIEVFDVAELLGALVDKSLVLAEPSGGALRYRLLETIRQFAAERQLESSYDEAAAVAVAHARHFLAFAESVAPHLDGSDQGRWLARLDADQANLLLAARYLSGDAGGTEQVLRLVVALRRYWMARHRGGDAIALLMPVLERPDARADPELFGMALVTASAVGRFIDVATARRLAEQAVELARQLDSERLLISALGVLSAACYFAGEPERGLPLGRESVERARTLGDDVLLAASLSGYLLCIDLFDPVSAGKLFDEAIACTQRSGDHLFAYILQNNAGVHALRVGDIPAARAHLEAAIQAAQANGENSDTVRINLGWVRRHDADYGGAWSSFEDGLRLSRRSGKRSDVAYAALGLACLAADAGEWSRAGELHGVAQAILDQTGEPWQEPEVRYRRESLAQIRAHLGEQQSDRDYARGMALNSDEILDLASRQDPRDSISAGAD